MQKFWLTLFSISGIAILQLGLSISTSAQEDNGCFMVNSTGKVVNLSALCGNGIAAPPSPKDNGTSTTSASNGRIFKAKIKRRSAGTPIIDVVFSGKNGPQKFEMIVDTGATGTVITGQMAEALGVVPVGTTRVHTAGGVVRVNLGYVDAIEINGAKIKDTLVAIQPILEVGLLGHDFFYYYDVTIKRDVVEFRIPQPQS